MNMVYEYKKNSIWICLMNGKTAYEHGWWIEKTACELGWWLKKTAYEHGLWI